VPEISMAATISHDPRRIDVSTMALLK